MLRCTKVLSSCEFLYVQGPPPDHDIKLSSTSSSLSRLVLTLIPTTRYPCMLPTGEILLKRPVSYVTSNTTRREMRAVQHTYICIANVVRTRPVQICRNELSHTGNREHLHSLLSRCPEFLSTSVDLVTIFSPPVRPY